MLTEITQIVGWILFSSVKFLFAPTFVYSAGYTYSETIMITMIGGAIGVLLFFYGGRAFFDWFAKTFSSKKSTNKKVVTKKNRLIVKIKNKYGVIGIAAVSPCLISIPIGAILASKYYRHDKRAIPTFMASVVFWSFTLTTITSIFGPISWEKILPF